MRLETTRLILRDWRADDLPALCRLTADPDVMRYIGAGATWSEEQTRAFIERQMAHAQQHGFCLWALQEKSGGAVIGHAGLQYLGTSTHVEIGWWLRRDCWGRGLATEAARRALREGFERAGLERIVAIANQDNSASQAVMRKIGLRYERMANTSEFGLPSGNIACVLYAIEKPDYEQQVEAT